MDDLSLNAKYIEEALPQNDNELEDEDQGDGLYEHFRVTADKGQQLLRIDKFLMDHLRDT